MDIIACRAEIDRARVIPLYEAIFAIRVIAANGEIAGYAQRVRYFIFFQNRVRKRLSIQHALLIGGSNRVTSLWRLPFNPRIFQDDQNRDLLQHPPR